MEIYINAIIVASIWIVVALFFWKIYPLVKDNAVFNKAIEIVHALEENIGAGNGSIKFEHATSMLQKWLDKLGWKVDVGMVYDAITSAVGVLHTEQGKAPAQKYENGILKTPE